jgi:two-component system sensor histidine kinase PilS (NtrC family)
MMRWRAVSGEARETFWRSLNTLNVMRVVIAVMLLLYLFLDSRSEKAATFAFAETCIVYLLLAVVFLAVTAHSRRRFLLQLMAQVLVDIAVIALLYLGAGGMRSGLSILFLFPIAGAAILAPLLLALFTTSLVTLFLLLESTWQIFALSDAGTAMQAGLYGAAYFSATILVNRLAQRLIRQEELAVRRGADLAIQETISRMVIADMDDGILVVDANGRIQMTNPAAQRMLDIGLEDEHPLLDQVEGLEAISQAFAEWRREPAQMRMAHVTVKPRHLKLRFTRVATPDGLAERCVVFMEDVTAIENKAQELKLASMGRLTASIAHEVRNPLSAIGHATSLLAEDLEDKSHVRLLRIVSDNVTRVNRMVEDILKLSRKVQPNGDPLQLDDFLTELKTEFQETHQLDPQVIWIGDTGASPVRFDPLHLREVVVNLLNNAVRYASLTPGSIRMYTVDDGTDRMELHVQDDGPGITPEVRAHLFEPFYTTSSKGTGLGLYLARELCLNNDATLDYEYRLDAHAFGLRRASGRFVITFAEGRV